jgi:hypothetical protein
LNTPLVASVTRARERYFGALLAIFITPQSALVLLFGLIGLPGNSVISGLVLSGSTAAVWVLTFRRRQSLLLSDYLFMGLIAAIACSFALHSRTSDPKEYALLLLSLSAYPACRFIAHSDLAAGRSGFLWTEAALSFMGAAVTAWALYAQWDDPHGKPLVFGFEGAAIFFLDSVSFLLFALLTIGKTPTARVVWILLALVLPVAIFAASLVRFTFIALACTLIIAAYISNAERRRNIIIAGLVMAAAVSLGLLARYEKVAYFTEFALEQRSAARMSKPSMVRPGATATSPPSCLASVDLDNSLAIRKALINDALWMLPRAGPVGDGLDSFMNISCIPQTEVHNSVLQAFVEFGWFGGSFFVLLILSALVSLRHSARRDDASRFIFCSLTFVILVALAHGRFSRDAVLFALLGAAAGLRSSATYSHSPEVFAK